MTHIVNFLIFLVGSALAVESGKEIALVAKKRNYQNSPEKEYREDVASKKPRSSLGFDNFEDSTVKVSSTLLGLSNIITEVEFPKDTATRILTPHPFHKHKRDGSFTFRAHSPGPDNSNQSEMNHESVEDLPTVNPKLAKWRKEFFSSVQANDSLRLESLKPEIDDANFRIHSPINCKNFTFPLHFALRHNLNNAVSFLMEEGLFDPQAKDSYGHTALSLTIELGNYRNFTDLLEVSNVHESVLGGINLTHLAASMNTLSPIFLKGLQSKGVDFTTRCQKRNWTPLQYAVAANNTVLAFWLNENTPCNIKHVDNYKIVLDALMEGNEDMAIKLIEKEADMTVQDSSNRNILHLIAKNNFLKVLNYVNFDVETSYIMLNAVEEVKGYCPAHYAAENNNFQVLLWIYRKFHLNTKTRDGLSVVQVALRAGSTEVVLLMFDEELFDWKDSFGTKCPPILVIAYQTGHMEMTRTILKSTHEDYYYLFDEKGLNVLHHAVIRNDFSFIELLVETYGFDPFFIENVADEFPANSPFAWAIYTKNAPLVEYFLEKNSFRREMVRLSLFSIEEDFINDFDPDDQEDIMDIEQLASIFGDDHIIALIEQNK
jgi:ankyrin repeat protein